jgi:hypothetical protein
VSITLRDRYGRWIECPCLADTSPECADAFALADAEWAALDDQPYPRGDWSGNPETFYRPHSHLGGDLPPFHPWTKLPLAERARRWRAGERPNMSLASGAREAAHAVAGVTFYDPNLVRFGNAASPFQVAPSFQEANLALQRRPEDRYSARYDSQSYFFEQPALASAPEVPDILSQARDALEAFLAGRPEVDGVAISYAGARLSDGRFVDTRPPGRGLLAEGETQPQLNAVEVAIETRAEGERLRALAGDEVMGVPIVYSARQEWSKRMPRIGRPLKGGGWFGIG